MNTSAQPPIATLRSELPFALVLQTIIMVVAGMILDGGGVLQICFYAFVAFWIGVGVLRFRRRGVLTRVDLFLIRYGFILACILSFIITRWIWQLRGYGQYL